MLMQVEIVGRDKELATPLGFRGRQVEGPSAPLLEGEAGSAAVSDSSVSWKAGVLASNSTAPRRRRRRCETTVARTRARPRAAADS